MTPMGPVEEPEGPGDPTDALDLEPPRQPVSPPPSPPPSPAPRAPEPVAPRAAPGAAPRSALWWVALSVLTMGSIGFMAGFIGPMIMAPSANEGPLLGIFFTGPLGVVLGLALGIACAVFSRKGQRVPTTLVVAGNLVYAAAIVLVILRGGN